METCAAQVFADEVATHQVPSIRAIGATSWRGLGNVSQTASGRLPWLLAVIVEDGAEFKTADTADAGTELSVWSEEFSGRT